MSVNLVAALTAPRNELLPALVNAVLTRPRVLIVIHLCGVLTFHRTKVLRYPVVTSYLKKPNRNESTVPQQISSSSDGSIATLIPLEFVP